MKLTKRLAAIAVATTMGLTLTATGAHASGTQVLRVTPTTHFGLTSSQLGRLEKRSKTIQTYYIWEMTSLSCALHDDCEALGWTSRVTFNTKTKSVKAVSVVFAEHWNGSSWSTQRMVNPGRAVELISVSCYAPNNCIAVGAYGSSFLSSAKTKPLIERWDGVRWRQVAISAPKAKDSQDALYSVSCTVFGQCTALGGIEALRNGSIRTYSERFDGLQWTRSSAPDDGLAEDISCPQWGDCFALSRGQTGITHQEGNRWVEQKLGLPKHALLLAFTSLSCGSVDDCVATGVYAAVKRSATGAVRVSGGPIFEHFNGSRWSRMVLPRSAYDPAQLSETPVSCSSNGHCVAAGNAVKKGYQTLVLKNGKWRVVTVNGNSTAVISCPDFDYCIATNMLALIAQSPTLPKTKPIDIDDFDASVFNGRRWRSVVMPLPAFSFRLALN